MLCCFISHFALIAGGGGGDGNEENFCYGFSNIVEGVGGGRAGKMILNIFVLSREYNRSESSMVFDVFGVVVLQPHRNCLLYFCRE